MVGTTKPVKIARVMKMWHFRDLKITKIDSKRKEDPYKSKRPKCQNFVIVKKCSPSEEKHAWDENLNNFNIKDIVDVKMELCRVCLNQGTVPIHGDNPSEDLADAIHTFGGIDISIFDSYPKYLCDTCHKLLQGAMMFRKTAQTSDQLFKKSTVPATDTINDAKDIDNEVYEVRLTDSGTFFDEPMESEPEIDDHFSGCHDYIFTEVPSMLEPEVSINASNSESAGADEAPYFGTLACNQCDIQFDVVEDYKNHKLHTKNHKKKMCTVCRQTYAAWYTKKYNPNIQKTESTYVCQNCYRNINKVPNKLETNDVHDFAMEDKTIGFANKAIKERKVVLTCKQCEVVFDKFQDYREHRLHKRKHKKKMCTICNNTYAVRCTKQFKQKTKKMESIYVCDVCYRNYSDKCKVEQTFTKMPMSPELEINDNIRESSMGIAEDPNNLELNVSLQRAQEFDNLSKKPKPLESEINAINTESATDVNKAHCLTNNLTCIQCDIQFNSFKDYKEHKIYIKKHKKKLCTACTQTYAKRYTRKYNPTTKKMEKMYVCAICYANVDKVFNNPSVFSNDFAVEHVNKALEEQKVVLTCHKCDIVFDKYQDFREHRLHTSVHKKRKCTVCHSTYAARYIRKYSINTDVTGLYVCNICFKKDLNELVKDLTKICNETKVNTLKCRKCNISFSTLPEFTYHRCSHRKKQCPICYQIFTRYKIRQHMMQVHNIEQPSYVCDICGKHYPQQCMFIKHRKNHFIMPNSFPYKCTMCPYKTHDNNNLKIHIRSHTGERPYLCEQCPKKFVTKSNLIKHTYTHKVDHDFKCECGKGYHTKRQFDIHIRAEHDGIKEHICQICGKAFAYRKVLMHHQLRVHKRERLKGGKQPTYLKLENQTPD